eukprot:jgi/Ulvmu1/2883/UM146_0025.1
MAVEFEETSSLQVLGTVTADAFVTVSLALFSFDGSVHDALFPEGLFSSPSRKMLAGNLLDVMLLLLLRATISVASVVGVRGFNSRCGLFITFIVNCAMAIWMGAKAVLAMQCSDSNLHIQMKGSETVIDVWWLNITLAMSVVFSFAEHSLCVAWASTFRGERWIEMSHYQGDLLSLHRRSTATYPVAVHEPLLQPLTTEDGIPYP